MTPRWRAGVVVLFREALSTSGVRSTFARQSFLSFLMSLCVIPIQAKTSALVREHCQPSRGVPAHPPSAAVGSREMDFASKLAREFEAFFGRAGVSDKYVDILDPHDPVEARTAELTAIGHGDDLPSDARHLAIEHRLRFEMRGDSALQVDAVDAKEQAIHLKAVQGRLSLPAVKGHVLAPQPPTQQHDLNIISLHQLVEDAGIVSQHDDVAPFGQEARDLGGGCA